MATIQLRLKFQCLVHSFEEVLCYLELHLGVPPSPQIHHRYADSENNY